MIQEPIIRLTRPADANVLSMLDLKCYQYPLSLDKWKSLAGESGKKAKPKVVVCEAMRKPCGFSVWRDVDEDVARIVRLGVIPKYRGHGLGRLLLNKVIDHCRVEKKDRLRVILPDIHCKPGDPDDVSGFLSKHMFHTTGEVVDGFRYMYGGWRDGYVFERNIVHD